MHVFQIIFCIKHLQCVLNIIYHVPDTIHALFVDFVALQLVLSTDQSNRHTNHIGLTSLWERDAIM